MPQRSSMRRTSTQADMFSPSFHSSRRRGEISSGVFSMVGTIVGGGTLSIPWAVAKSGLALGLSLLLLSALISATAVTFLLSAARRCGGLRTYDAVLEAACGRWARTLTSWSVVATCFLTLCANQILLRQLAVPLVAEYALRRPLGHAEGLLVGAGLVSCVVPLTYMSTLNSLRHVSLCSVMTVGVLVVVLGVKGFGCSPPPSLPPVELASADVLSALPVFVVCYLCSFSVLPLDTELRRPSRSRMKLMITSAFGIAFSLYAVAGVAGILYARCATGGAVASNVLTMFPTEDPLASLMRGALTLVLLLSLPLICLPCRNMVHRLMRSCLERTLSAEALAAKLLADRPDDGQPSLRPLGQHTGPLSNGSLNSAGQLPTLSGQLPSLPEGGGDGAPYGGATAANGPPHHAAGPVSCGQVPVGMPPPSASLLSEMDALESAAGTPSLKARVTLASILMLMSMGVAASVDDVSTVWGFLGSTCGILLAYVLPAVAYVVLRKTPLRLGSSVRKRKALALLISGLGLALVPLCLTEAIEAVLHANSTAS